MKTTRLLIMAIFVMSTGAHAALSETLTLQEQNNVRQRAQEMSGQGVPEEQAQKMLSLMHQNRYQEENIVRAQQAVINAALDDMPTEPLMNKAMEGMAKDVPEEKVIAAMETVRNRYRHAYQLARSLSNDPKINGPMAETIADCLAAGMMDQEMDVIMDRLRGRTRQQTKKQADDLSLQTMRTVRSMVRLGANPGDTTNTVCERLQSGYIGRQMEQFRYRFTNEAQHTPAQQLAHQYARSIGQGSGAGGNNSGGNGSDGNGSGGNGSGGNGSGGNGSGGNGSGGNGSGGNGSGGSGSGGNGGGGGKR
ncbi:MAG: hypothetical protein ACI8ZB_001274 [Desulforhopalus sp.]|jgi:hypothetical protein